MRSLLNFKGMSLVEVTIAGALAVGLGLYVFKINQNMSSTVRDMEDRMEIQDLAKNIQLLMSNPKVCTDTLLGLDINATDFPILIQEKDADGNFIETFEEKYIVDQESKNINKKVSTISLSQISLEDVSLPETGNGLGKVYFKYQFRKRAGSPFSRLYKILLSTKIKNGLFTECSSTPIELINAATRSVCQSFGGVYSGEKCRDIDGSLLKKASVTLHSINGAGFFGTTPPTPTAQPQFQCPIIQPSNDYEKASGCKNVCYSDCYGQKVYSAFDQCKIRLNQSNKNGTCLNECTGKSYSLTCNLEKK